jgi:hypothetical protein
MSARGNAELTAGVFTFFIVVPLAIGLVEVVRFFTKGELGIGVIPTAAVSAAPRSAAGKQTFAEAAKASIAQSWLNLSFKCIALVKGPRSLRHDRHSIGADTH